MKIWIDANRITECAEVQRDKYMYEDLMREKPNWNKKEIKGNKKKSKNNKFKYKK